jgi:hypothetical protein
MFVNRCGGRTLAATRARIAGDIDNAAASGAQSGSDNSTE